MRKLNPLTHEGEPESICARWVFAGELGYDFRGLMLDQVRRIAPFVVEATWRRGLGPLLLIHGDDRAIRGELRAQLRVGDWLAWAYFGGSKQHARGATRILLALRDHPSPIRSALPEFEPGSEDFDSPRCVGDTRNGRQCGSRAALGAPYCGRHTDELR
jgi:hypothetical protein